LRFWNELTKATYKWIISLPNYCVYKHVSCYYTFKYFYCSQIMIDDVYFNFIVKDIANWQTNDCIYVLWFVLSDQEQIYWKLKLLKIDVNKWSNYEKVSEIKVGFKTENILKDLNDRDIYDFRQECRNFLANVLTSHHWLWTQSLF
jgi:hypothetical protein